MRLLWCLRILTVGLESEGNPHEIINAVVLRIIRFRKVALYFELSNTDGNQIICNCGILNGNILFV